MGDDDDADGGKKGKGKGKGKKGKGGGDDAEGDDDDDDDDDDDAGGKKGKGKGKGKKGKGKKGKEGGDDDDDELTPVGTNCNCGAKRVEEFKSGKTVETCNDACNSNPSCKSFGYWTEKGKGSCALFDKACSCDGVCSVDPTNVAAGYKNDA